MHLERLWLTDFRSYRHAEFAPAPQGITVVTGANGEGKTNLLEAIGYLATLRSLRGNPSESLIRTGDGAERAVVRMEGRREARRIVVEAEISATGRSRAQVNGQALRRVRDLLGALQVTVFTPEDLALVKGGPQGRRQYLDDLLVALHPRHDATIAEVERVLKQRTALLKSAGWQAAAGRGLAPDVESTLEVWDAKLAAAGDALARARAGLAEALGLRAADAYRRVASGVAHRGRDVVSLHYETSWQGSLAEALRAARGEDLRRGVSTVGPHRDDLRLQIGSTPARTHASQGEQRSLALALRLAGHHLVAERIGSEPVLLLDDIFSELDASRAEALLACLPSGQAIITTAGHLPVEAVVAAWARIEDGKLLA